MLETALVLENCHNPEHAGGEEAIAQLERRRIGRGIHDRKAHVFHVGPNREAKQQDLDDRQQNEHRQRSAVAKNVIRLLPEEPPE